MSNAPLGFSFGSQGLAGFNHHYGDCKHGGPGSQGGGSASGGGGSSNRRRPSPLPPPQFGHRHRATCHLRQRCATGRRLLRGRRTNLARRPLFLPGFRSAAVLRSRSGPNLGGLGVLAVVYPLLSFAISPFPFASWRPWRLSTRSRHSPFPLSPLHLGVLGGCLSAPVICHFPFPLRILAVSISPASSCLCLGGALRPRREPSVPAQLLSRFLWGQEIA